MAERTTLTIIAEELGAALRPLVVGTSSNGSFYSFMRRLGWDINQVPPALADTAALARVLLDLVDDGELDASAAASFIGRLVDVFDAIDDLQNIGGLPATVDVAEFRAEFPSQLVEYLIVDYLLTHRSTLGSALLTAGVIKLVPVAANGLRLPYERREVAWGALGDLFSDPIALFRSAYRWGDPAFDGEYLLANLHRLARSLGLEVYSAPLEAQVEAKLHAGAVAPTTLHDQALWWELLGNSYTRAAMTAGIRFAILPATAAQSPGFAILPYATGVATEDFNLSDVLTLTLKAGFDFGSGVALLVRPGQDIELVADLLGAGGGSAASELGATLRFHPPGGGKQLVLGSTEGSRFEYGSLGFGFGARIRGAGERSVYFEVELRDAALVIRPGADGDAFIARLLPADITADLSVTAGIDSSTGIYFSGSGGLEIAIPLHIALGPVELISATLAVKPDGGLAAELGLSAKGQLGPLAAVVENIGVRTIITFPPQGGNLGPADLALRFKPPNGVGLSVDAGVIQGGGYLFIDAERGEYAGALELTFSEFLSLKAIGLISTRMPDGSRGFSLLIIITAEFGTGIQLGFGFTLLAVGGLLGLNRTMRLQALMEGVRSGALNSIMFPRDVVANAPRIISDLRAFFPPQEGIFLIGPMARLGWGTPTLISISLGIIIEIPGNIAIIGVLRIALPAEEAEILVLQVNFAGAIEFSKRRIYFFAALFESRILFMTIEGEMGLLVAFGDDANFVVSVGGFHPRFAPPPLPFPAPTRVSVNLINESWARVRADGYFAVTPNSVQFGARVEIFFGLDEINIEGHLAFDALFQFSPFYFIISISASWSVNVFGAGLFSVRFRGSLEGPALWRVAGEGSISVLFFDISCDFEVTWGEERDTILPPVEVMPLLAAELAKGENWRALLPPGNNLLVTLRRMAPEEAALVLHPVGTLRISQRALPLELTLGKVGHQKPSDVKRLRVGVAAGGLAKKADTYEQFAPAQFQEMRDSQKLSSRAFAPEKAGLELSPAGEDLRTSGMVRRTVRYEEIVLDSNFRRTRRRFQQFVASLFNFFLNGSAIVSSEVSRARTKQYQPFDDKVEVSPDTYTVAFQANNRAYAPEAIAFRSEASAREFMNREMTANARLAGTLHVIPSWERAA